MRRRRLRYRAAHRGTRELDLLLGPFADAYVDAMTESELDGFELLLSAEETDLQAWLLSQAEPLAIYNAIIAQILEFKRASLS